MIGFHQLPPMTKDQLEHRLLTTRLALLNSLLKEIMHLYHSHSWCKTSEEAQRWYPNFIERLIKYSEINIKRGEVDKEPRVICPLCGRTPQGEIGFKYPKGLEQHFKGHRKTRQCDILNVLRENSLDYFQQRFSQTDTATEANTQQHEEKQRTGEILYKVSLVGKPQHMSEHISTVFDVPTRTKEELELAEMQLVNDFGFVIDIKDNVKAYISENSDFVVFADPRIKGQIDFTVYRKSIKRPHISRFFIRDGYYNKYEQHLLEALG